MKRHLRIKVRVADDRTMGRDRVALEVFCRPFYGLCLNPLPPYPPMNWWAIFGRCADWPIAKQLFVHFKIKTTPPELTHHPARPIRSDADKPRSTSPVQA